MENAAVPENLRCTTWAAASAPSLPAATGQGSVSQFLPPETPTPAHAFQLSGTTRRLRPRPAAEAHREASGALSQPSVAFASEPAQPRSSAGPGRLAGVPGRVGPVGAAGRTLLCHNAWPPAQHPGRASSATPTSTPGSSAWVPYALGHGLNPLVSTFVNFPQGVNLMWNTSVLLPSFLMSPVTVIFGAAFSYNILATAAPALGSTFAYMAFRRWTGRAPVAGGRPHLRVFALHGLPICRPPRPDPDHERAADADRAGPASGGAGEQAVGRRAAARASWPGRSC